MAADWCMYSWVGGRVGWGGVGLLTSMVNGSLTHTSCYATVCPLRLPRMGHATLLYGSSRSEEFHVKRSQAVSRHFDHSWYPNVEPVLEVFEDFLPAHMVLKCKERGHSTLHPSVTQCVFMWCWRSSLQSPDLEELEALL